MTIGEVGEALRGRMGRSALWSAFALAMGAWLSVPVILWLVARPRPTTANLYRDLLLEAVSGGTYFFAFIWLSPIPWQWNGRSGGNPSPGRRMLGGFLAAELMAVLLVALSDGLNRSMGRMGFQWDSYVINLGFQGPALFLVGSLFATRERLEVEREELRRRTDAVMAEHLKGQVHPHVLFNTLNGLAELMQRDKVAAEGLVEAMSGFLQRVLEASQRPAWPLGEERSLAEDYLRMEGTRLGDRLRVAWEWDSGLDGHPVLPLLLQPLIENAVKHGINPEDEGGEIRISVGRVGADLALTVLNTGESLYAGPSHRRGLGLPNLRRRLELAYGEEAAFDLAAESEGWTAARIRVKLSTTPRL